MLKISESEVRNVIDSYDLMQKHGITETQEQKKFSAVYEITKNREMKKLRVDEPGLFDNCIEAVKEGRFSRAEDVRDLPKIMNDKKARKAFVEERLPIDEAAEIAKARHPEHADSFYRIVKRATTAIEDCDAKRIQQIKGDGNRAYELKRLSRALSRLLKQIGMTVE